MKHFRGPVYVEQRGLDSYMSDEIQPSIDHLRDDGFTISTFAYPYGSRTDETDRAIWITSRSCAPSPTRGIVPRPIRAPTINWPRPRARREHRVRGPRADRAPAEKSGKAIVADGDIQLRAAIADSLKPWLIEVVAAPSAPADIAAAMQQATDAGARYVIWREGAELVVLDREGDRVERREAPAGTLDALAAAAAALSVKTMLRLPALPAGTVIDKPKPHVHHDEPVDPYEGVELRVNALVGGRFEYGLDSNVALRFGGSFGLRPWRDEGWRFGAIGDGGASATVDRPGSTAGGRTGPCSRSRAGTRRSTTTGRSARGSRSASSIRLSGTEMMSSRSEEAFSPALRGGAAARYRMGEWFVGGQLAVEGLLTNTTYTKLDTPAQVFEIPRIGAVLSLIVGVDFAPG